ncbi:MAG TPA: hypothetical protein VM581_03110, partial [Magnetospirillaceae bacterium]|nr:hypothetical protein [Magnetospirillaceae bacterium]
SPRLTDAEYRQWATTFADAWSFLQDHDPHLANIVRAHLTTIVPAPSEPLTHSKTMAAGASLGVIGFNENRDPTRLLSQIAFGIRKDMALALRTEMPEIYPEEGMHTPVYPPSREGYGIAAHLQDDTFINVGLARFYHSLLQSGDSKLRDYYELSFARWYTESRQNLDAWKQSGYGQDRNAWLPNSLGNELYALKHTFDSISEAVRQTVATNARDRHANWRLRTIIPDPQAIIYLRDVWTSGRDCPYITVPGTLNQSNEAYIHIGQRTRYVLAEVKVKEPALFAGVTVGSYDPKLFGEPTPGDIAFANDNIAEARRYFTASIRQRGSNTDAWAGLALTFEHEHSPAAEVFTQQPELAAALYATIGDATIDPENIAAWLAPSRVAKLCLGA